MGQTESVFNEQELKDYEDLTYFTKREIEFAYQRFRSLCPDIVQDQKNPSLPEEVILTMPELIVNPFKDRLCKVFCSEEGFMSFEDFLDMMSVFSDRAPKSVKTEYAFRIYDFNEDDLLTYDDIEEVLRRIKGHNDLDSSDSQEIIERVLLESDTDEDGVIAFTEFENMITKSADFLSTFRILL